MAGTSYKGSEIKDVDDWNLPARKKSGNTLAIDTTSIWCLTTIASHRF